MTSSSVDRRVSSSTSILGPALALLLAAGCSSGGGVTTGAGGTAAGGTTGGGGSSANGGTSGTGGGAPSGGTAATGGTTGKGGTTGSGGVTSSGGVTGSGGAPGSGGTPGTGGTSGSGGTPGSGGVPGSGGAGKGGTTGTGGVPGSGGNLGRDGGPGRDAAPGTGGAIAIDGGGSCPTTMPSGGQTCTGTSCNGTADGLGYGIWTNGSGGTITYFTNAHAFSTSWNNSQDFLAHLGLDFRPAKASTAYGTIVAEFSEVKTVTTNPPWSMIGMYGWMNSPCIEWYIDEDSFNGLGGRGSTTATIDGATYYLSTQQTTGTGGANACESGHTGTWTQIHSTRSAAHTCGTVTVTDHFKAWAAQGWSLGSLTMVHINMEVGGGNGKIDFPLANVTAN